MAGRRYSKIWINSIGDQFMKMLNKILMACFCSFAFFNCAELASAQNGPLIFENEYVLRAKGPFCPWDPGVKSCPEVKEPGVYTLRKSETGRTKLIRLDGNQAPLRKRKLIPYDPKKDLCRSKKFKGQDCSPNYFIELKYDPNDPKYLDQWGMWGGSGSYAAAAWDKFRGQNSAVIVVLDTGVDTSHPDIRPNLFSEGFNAITNSATQYDDAGHGTHVAGIAAARGDNGLGVSGVCMYCQILPIKFMTKDGGSTFDAVKGIDYLIALAKQRTDKRFILNNSWGGGGNSAPLFRALIDAEKAGVLIVNAAGNDGAKTCVPFGNYMLPACWKLQSTISVASINKVGALSTWSNYNKHHIRIAAPGEKIVSTLPGNRYGSMSGTSMAAPHVAGAAGLLWSANPTLNRKQLKRLLDSYARPLVDLKDKLITGGTLNLEPAFCGECPRPDKGISDCNRKKLRARIKKCRKKFHRRPNKKFRCVSKAREDLNCLKGVAVAFKDDRTWLEMFIDWVGRGF